MKFTQNTCLHFLEKDVTPFDFTVARNDYTQQEVTFFGLSLVPVMNQTRIAFAQNVFYMTDPFHDAWRRGSHRLVDLFDKEDINETGTLISSVPTGGMNTIFYHIDTRYKDGVWLLTAMLMAFHKSRRMEKPCLEMFVSYRQNVEKSYMGDQAKTQGVDALSFTADIIMFILFKKYCQLETKIVTPGQKIKHLGDKYLNETKSNIQILDSTWFTTIIRNEGFGVQGHFRWQPFGPKLSQKKLIYIAAYEKEGYTRKAAVLNKTT